MGFGALAVILVISVAVGVAVQVAEQKFGYTWFLIGALGTFGAYFASETFPGSTVFQAVKDWGPQYDGFYIIPGVIAGAILAAVGYVGTRTLETTTAAA